MLDQSLQRLGKTALDEVYNTILLPQKQSYHSLTDTAMIWLWCNLTPSQALEISGRHSEVYYDIFDHHPQTLKNLCMAIKESIKQNPEVARQQLFPLRYSLEKNTLRRAKPHLLDLTDPSENAREITKEDIACVSEVLHALAVSQPTQNPLAVFTKPILRQSETQMSPHWLIEVLEHVSQAYPHSMLHDEISEYLFAQQLSVVIQERSSATEKEKQILTNIINHSSLLALDKVRNSWANQTTSPKAWRTQFEAWKNSNVPSSVWHKKLPTQEECLHTAQWGFNQGPYFHEALNMICLYPFDEDPNGLEKARSVVPLLQKYILYLMLTVNKNARLPAISTLVDNIKKSKHLSSLMKENLVSSVQWKVWCDFGGTSPQTSDAKTLKELITSPEFKKTMQLLPPLLRGTIENVHNHRLGETATLPMLRMAQLKKIPDKGPFLTWNNLFTKHSIQKELGKKKRLQTKIKNEIDQEKTAPPKRRM